MCRTRPISMDHMSQVALFHSGLIAVNSVSGLIPVIYFGRKIYLWQCASDAEISTSDHIFAT